MTPKELLLTALRNGQTERPAWVPFVGVHGAALLGGISAEDYLRDSRLMVEGLARAHERYRPDGLPVAFDLQLEAEVLGCGLSWAREYPPSVVTHPLADGEDLDPAQLPAFSVEKGRFPLIWEVLAQMKSRFGEATGIYGLITGPLTLATHLRGESLLLDLFDQPERVHELLGYCAGVAQQTAAAYLEMGADVIAVVDPMTSQISPQHFDQWMTGPLNEIFDAIHRQQGLAALFVCGNATRNLERMVGTHCDHLSVDENVDLTVLRDLCRKFGKSFGGNLRLTTALLLGGPDEVLRDTFRCLDTGGDAGFVLAPGCDLPYATPAENLELVAQLVHHPNRGETAFRLPRPAESDSFDDVAIPDYTQSGQLIVDVVTLDSSACAPCAYMLRAAREACREAGIPADVREHRISSRDGLGYMHHLGVTAIPTICIQGKPVFSSIIPSRSELVDALQRAIPATR